MALSKEFIESRAGKAIRADNLKDLEPLIDEKRSDRVLGPEDRIEIDDLTSGIERFRAAFKTGQSTLVSSFAGADAAIASITGNEERMNESLKRAKEEREAGAYYLLDSQPFEEFIDKPTFSGFIDSAIEATGQFAPTAITSIIAALSGAGVGASLSYLTGSSRLFAAAGSTGLNNIPATIATQKFVKTEVEDILKKKVTLDMYKKQGIKTSITMSPTEEKVINLLYPYLRGQLRRKYATTGALGGAFAQEQPIGTGIAFQDYAEQDMTDPITAFRAQQQGAVFGLIGVGSEALIFQAIMNNIKSKAAKKLINERAVLDAPLGRQNALDIVARGLGAGALTGLSEGVAEGLQEELSIQQKKVIDRDYTNTQANLDRLQAYYMGAIGGMGIGTATGTSTAVLGKMRELAEIGFEKKYFDLYQRAKGKELNPILETQDDLSAQFADMQNPKIDREFVWADVQNYESLAPILNRVNKIPNLSKTRIEGVGTFFTTNPELNQRFTNTMSASPLNRQRLLNFLDIYGKKPPSEGKSGMRVVVTVRDRNGSIVKRYDAEAGQEEQSAISAAQNYIGGPDGTNGRNIVVQTLDAFNEERAGKFPKEQEKAMEEDFGGSEQVQQEDELDTTDDFTRFETEQERLFAQDTQNEPQIVPDITPKGKVTKKAKQQGSLENPFGQGQTGKPFAAPTQFGKDGKETTAWKKRVQNGDPIYNEIISLMPDIFVSEFSKLVQENKINDSAGKRYINLAKDLRDLQLFNDEQGLGFGTQGDGVVIYKYDMPGVATAIGTQTVTRDVIKRAVDMVVDQTKERQSQFTILNKETNETTSMDPNKFTNVGRQINNRFGDKVEGNLQSAIAGFGRLLADMSLNGYEVQFNGKPFSDQNGRDAPIYRVGGRLLSLNEMERAIGNETSRNRGPRKLETRIQRAKPLPGQTVGNPLGEKTVMTNVPLTETTTREGLERNDQEGLENILDEAEARLQEAEEALTETEAAVAAEKERLVRGLTPEQIAAGMFVSKRTGKVVKPFTPKKGKEVELENGVKYVESVNLNNMLAKQDAILERAKKNVEFKKSAVNYAEQGVFEANEEMKEAEMQEDPNDQYAFDSFPLFREWAKRPQKTEATLKREAEKRDNLKEEGYVKYSTTIEQHLGVEFLDTMKRIAKNTLGLKRELMIFSTQEDIIVDDPELQRRIDATLRQFDEGKILRGKALRGKGNTDVLLVQTREGFNIEDQGARLFVIAHEIGHSFIYQELDRSLKNPRLRQALEKAFADTLKNNKTKQYQLDGEAGFQEWIADQIAVFLVDQTKKATNQTESFFKNIASKINAFFTKYSNVAKRRFTQNPVFTEYIQEVMAATRNNNFRYEQKAKIEEKVEQVEKVITKGAQKTLKRTVNRIIETGEIPNSKVDAATRTLRTIFQDKDGLLRSFGAPGEALAKLFKQRVGTKEGTGYLTKVFSLARAKMNEIQTILGVEKPADMNQEVEKVLQELEDPNKTYEELSPKAQQIRDFLVKHYRDLNLGELGVGFIENYFPRLFLMEELLNDAGKRETLIDLLVEYNPTLSKKEAQETVTEMLRDPEEDPNFNREEEETFAVGMLANRAELFRNIPTNALREAQLLEDASYSLQRYIQNSVKRRGFADFGGSKAIKEQLNKIKDPKERELAEQAVRAILGRVDPIQSNLFRNVNNVGLLFNVTTLLPLSVFASFPDVAGPILRYRGIPNFIETMRTVMAAMTDAEAAQFAKDVGATGINAMNEQYVGAGELQYTSKGTKKVTNMFFRFIQLEQFTNFTRRFAAGMARVFLIDNATKALAGDETALRYLEELDVTAEEVMAWGDGDITAPANQRVRLAIARFVDEAIVRPNAAERPLWASDPRFALVWQLKSFFYSYGKNIVMGTGREMQSRMQEAGIKGAAIPLFMAAVTLLPLTMLGLDIRERFKVGLAWALPGVSPQDKDYRRSLDMDYGEYSVEILDRSGILGPFTMALPLFVSEKRYGDPLWVGPLGPTIGTGYDLISGDIKAKNLIPFYSAL